MSIVEQSSKLTEASLLISFIDLSGFEKACKKLEDQEIAQWMNEFYCRVESAISSAGGRVIKFMGDAALIVFESRLAESGIRALLNLKAEVDEWCQNNGIKSRLEVKIHFGSAVVGLFGTGASARLDILGKAVNTTATLEGGPFCMSAQAFRQLSVEGRKLFKKHTPQVTYIRVDDRHS